MINLLLLTVPLVKQSNLTKKEHEIFITSIIKQIQKIPHTNLTIKLHPIENNLKDYQAIIKPFKNVTVIKETPSLPHLMMENDILICFGSTTVVEALILDKNVILLTNPKFDSPFTKILQRSKAVIEVADMTNLPQEILKLYPQRKVLINL